MTIFHITLSIIARPSPLPHSLLTDGRLPMASPAREQTALDCSIIGTFFVSLDRARGGGRGEGEVRVVAKLIYMIFRWSLSELMLYIYSAHSY